MRPLSFAEDWHGHQENFPAGDGERKGPHPICMAAQPWTLVLQGAAQGLTPRVFPKPAFGGSKGGCMVTGCRQARTGRRQTQGRDWGRGETAGGRQAGVGAGSPVGPAPCPVSARLDSQHGAAYKLGVSQNLGTLRAPAHSHCHCPFR